MGYTGQQVNSEDAIKAYKAAVRGEGMRYCELEFNLPTSPLYLIPHGIPTR